MKISVLAQRTGATAPTIRYYESIGLLPEASRLEGGQRRYTEADVQRLQFIRRCREFGFSIEQVRDLAQLVTDESRCCTEARDIARSRLDDVRTKMAELKQLEGEIAEFVQRCDDLCVGGPGPSCVPLTALARITPSRKAPAS